jgi:hypothetical protein
MDSTNKNKQKKKTTTTNKNPEITYIIRKKGINHLQRLLRNGCLIENKTIYYLKGKEKETLRLYLQQKTRKNHQLFQNQSTGYSSWHNTNKHTINLIVSKNRCF